MADQTRPYQLTDQQAADIIAALTNQGTRYTEFKSGQGIAGRYIRLADLLLGSLNEQRNEELARRDTCPGCPMCLDDHDICCLCGKDHYDR